jgi:hypothetical protein
MLTVVPRADSTVLCHVLTHAGVAISFMSIIHRLDSLSKVKLMKVITEVETSSPSRDHSFLTLPQAYGLRGFLDAKMPPDILRPM